MKMFMKFFAIISIILISIFEEYNCQSTDWCQSLSHPLLTGQFNGIGIYTKWLSYKTNRFEIRLYNKNLGKTWKLKVQINRTEKVVTSLQFDDNYEDMPTGAQNLFSFYNESNDKTYECYSKIMVL